MTHRSRPAFVRITALLVAVGAALLLATCSSRPGLREQVRTLGTLRVALVNSAAGYYTQADGPAGFEYDLARDFAHALNLDLAVIAVANAEDALAAVASGAAHMAAGLPISYAPGQPLRFTPPYAHIELDVVYNAANPQPQTLADLNGKLTIAATGALATKLARRYPQIDFLTDAQATPEALMAAVAKGELYSTIASAHLVAINQRYYPSLRVAFSLDGIRRNVAWSFAHDTGSGLYNQAITWLQQARTSGLIDILQQRYFAHAQRLGFVGGQIFAEQIKQRLPQWRDLFKQIGKKYDLDWRLLAAMSYQESHWDPEAVSTTGVRGLMMLTQATADELGLSDREDPQQSIDGGARYLIEQRKRLPETIAEPDRTWQALAAYNVGFGHLMDARGLLEAHDKDPDLWANMRTALAWLTQSKYNSKTRYGYAPGKQAVEYVGNIRAYYDILLWTTQAKPGQQPAALTRSPGPRPDARTDPDAPPAIKIGSPAL